MGEIERSGGCACGAVRYRVTGAPIMVHHCLCRICQRETGGTGVVNGFWETDRVSVESGEFTETELPGGSGEPHVVRRCTACHIAVLSHYPRLGRAMAAIPAGTLDDPASITPDVVVYTESKMDWVTLPEGIPSFPGYYNPRETLSPESLERLRALQKRD